MAFVQAKCESCGAILTTDSTKKAAICSYCGSAYVVQDSINYYNSVTKVENLHANVVNISDEQSATGRLRAAEAYMKLKRYGDAENEFKKVTELTPQNYMGWWGLIESYTYGFQRRIKSENVCNQLDDYAKAISVLTKDIQVSDLLNKYNEYILNERQKNNNDISIIKGQINEIDDKIRYLESQLDGFRFETTRIEREMDETNYILNKSLYRKDPRTLGIREVLMCFGIFFFAFGLLFGSTALIVISIPFLVIASLAMLTRSRYESIKQQLVNSQTEIENNTNDIKQKIIDLMQRKIEVNDGLSEYK